MVSTKRMKGPHELRSRETHNMDRVLRSSCKDTAPTLQYLSGDVVEYEHSRAEKTNAATDEESPSAGKHVAHIAIQEGTKPCTCP